jgi:hypothetical protein
MSTSSCRQLYSSSDGRSSNNNRSSLATAAVDEYDYDYQRGEAFIIDDDVLPIISDADADNNADNNNATTTIASKTMTTADIFMSSNTPLLAETLLIEQKYNDEYQSFISTSSTTIASTTIASTVAEATAPSTSSLTSSLLSEIIITILASYSLYGLLGNLLTQYEWVQTWRYLWPLFIGIYYCCFNGSAPLLFSSSSMSSSSSSLISMSKIASSLLSSSSSQQQEQEQQEQEQIEEQREEEEEEDILINTGSTTITDILQVLKISCGIGLFVGGMADAFLPVWMTGPNFITNAGLAPDCAVLLLLMSIIELVAYYYNVIKEYEYNNDDDDRNNRNGNSSQQQQQQIMSIIPTSLAPSSLSSSTSLPLLLLRITLWAELYKLGESSIDEIISSTASIFAFISQ